MLRIARSTLRSAIARMSARLSIFCLNVFSPSSGVSLHLCPLTLGSIGGLVSSLIGVLDGLSRLILCLIDALLELLAVLRGCRPRGRYDLLDLCLKEAAVGPAVS
jgi:hypothetical protein